MAKAGAKRSVAPALAFDVRFFLAARITATRKKQYCNTKTEICCRIEVSTLSGANDLQGSVGFGSATFNANSNTNRQGGLFASSNQGSSGSSFGAGQSGQAAFGSSQSGQAAFGSSQSGQAGNSQSGASFGAAGQRGTFGASGASGTFGQGQASFGSSSFGSSNRGSTFGQGTQGFGAQGASQGAFNAGSATRESGSTFESSTRGSGFGSTGKFGAGASFGIGSTVAPTTSRFGGNEVVYKQTSQSNFVETDSFSAGSDNAGIFRPGASGSGLKPGIPYLPPDNNNQPTNVVSSTAFPSTFATTPRPFTTPRPTYLPPTPPSTSAPGYLPPQGEQSINRETRLPSPSTYSEGELILDQSRTTPAPSLPPSELPSGCAAALKCTPIEYCTAEGVMSNTTVVLTRDQEAYRVPLTDCKDAETGRAGKCCRDPYYTDPWPTNQLGKWVPGVFGGNDGKYVSDSRGSPSVNRPAVTARPFSTGSTLLNNFRSEYPKPTVPSFGPNQVTPGYPTTVSQSSFGQKGQYEVRQQGQFGQGGQGQYSQAGQGQVSQGQAGQFAQGSQVSQNSFSQTQRGQGQAVISGQGQAVTSGQGQYSREVKVNTPKEVKAAQFNRDQSYAQTQRGQAVLTGQGQAITQGFGQGIRQGQGYSVENEYSESSQRVFLQQYAAGGQCGLFNGQKPYGNRNEQEVDFAEIPWQAMVLLQTNKSLLCGGVITRPDVVVTSAACVEGLQAKNVLIKGGEWKLGIDDEPLPFQIVQVKNILRHPFYKRGSLHFDAAILVLTENLRLAKNIYPICLPRASDTLDAFYNGAGECIVTGWGKQVLQGEYSWLGRETPAYLVVRHPSVPKNLAPSHVQRSARKPGTAADDAQTVKCRKYAFLKDNYFFAALAVETFGAWSSDTKKNMKEVSDKLIAYLATKEQAFFFPKD
ncbi:hypothetical protein MSG28_015497 [Choristoneura fumiferana]|uniref:Uncharacterized protein n=1 Tax=Choristoneura fumiferana TaxID=7141 RepID=A0ACC0KAD2_CHOFU|nr:hypothetical protein MSG28_015497 [Choristoneura fumiferana]